jgi:ribonuclease BN (tRNA processing enzyme)
MECSYLSNKPAKKHIELAEAIFLIRKALPGRSVLTHFYPEWDGVDFAAEVRRLAPELNVIQASDGLKLEI